MQGKPVKETTLKDKTPLDLLLEKQQEQVEALAKISELLSKSQDATLQRRWLVGNAGESQNIPFVGAKTLYVDNTKNSNDIVVRLDNEIGVHVVPVNCAGYVPCDGSRVINFEGLGTCYVLVLNIAVPPTTFKNVTTIAGTISNTVMEGYGATVTDRPSVAVVPIGFIFEAVTTQEFWQSDGISWVVI